MYYDGQQYKYRGYLSRQVVFRYGVIFPYRKLRKKCEFTWNPQIYMRAQWKFSEIHRYPVKQKCIPSLTIWQFCAFLSGFMQALKPQEIHRFQWNPRIYWKSVDVTEIHCFHVDSVEFMWIVWIQTWKSGDFL